ncbi:Nodule Cysteine-Rich (NCR) secreted peptide [Medicago truncatula]|uniref:Nodule Cysteine-Rich (NCR) secreted peptide n=1 Tax=Medicago truncatula TaxID=3880 RepID=A0A072UXR0_MEDTR|nr:Nodule Cysteine-Rich (NCR) secreted peptide [Medicago truncatula]
MTKTLKFILTMILLLSLFLVAESGGKYENIPCESREQCPNTATRRYACLNKLCYCYDNNYPNGWNPFEP